MSFNQPFNYDPNTGTWGLELHKAPKEVFAQCGMKITVNPGFPTGETKAFYDCSEKSGMTNSTLEIRYFDNLSGYVSRVVFNLPALIKQLTEIMPEGTVKEETFCLANADRKVLGEL